MVTELMVNLEYTNRWTGETYHVSVQQVLHRLTFKRLKIFNVSDLEQSSSHDECCTENLEELR